MKKILVWSVIPPFGGESIRKILADNLIGSNTGNLLFHASVIRTLMTHPDDQFEMVFSWVGKDIDAFAARANEECALFAIPLANAFRSDYIAKLDVLTSLIERLKIPCVVLGVGIQAGKPEQLEQGFAYDESVNRFVRAVLDKSAMLGVRGGMTARYLTHLGFREEEHFTRIGCPSMFLMGEDLPKTARMDGLNRDSKVCVNGKLESSMAIHALLNECCKELPNYWYLPQRIEEIWMMYAGMPIPYRKVNYAPEYFPARHSHRMIREHRSVAFLSVPAWLDFMRDKDFSYGCNIHGNIAAYLAGVPGLVVARDLRVAELAEYFEIPAIGQDAVAGGVSILDAYEKADFTRVQANHGLRFRHYVDFLNANGLDHIFRDGVQDVPYDARMRTVEPLPPVWPREKLTLADRVDAMPIYSRAVRHYWKKYKIKFKAKLRRIRR